MPTCQSPGTPTPLRETINILFGMVSGMDNIDGHDWVGILVAVLAGLVVLALSFVAMVQIGRAAHLSPSKRTNWVLAVLLAPVFGATAWFAVGNRLRLD